MDPKLSGNLDPKLQEAYDRVMNGPTTPPVAGVPPTPNVNAQQQPPVSPQPAAQTVPPAPNPAPSFGGVQPVVPSEPVVNPASPAPSIGGVTPGVSAGNQTVAVKHKGSKSMPLIMGLGIVVFLLAYTFMWIYVFKLNVPFLPQF
jgi:hypothetical protein